MKNVCFSILKITAILLLSFIFLSISVYADFDNEKYLKVHIRNVVDTLSDGIPEFDNDSIIIYQENDQIVTDNIGGPTLTICFKDAGGTELECYEMNNGERIQHYIPVSSREYVVKTNNTVRDIVVLTPHKPVPALSTYGLILLFVLLMISSVLVIRRRTSRAVNL